MVRPALPNRFVPPPEPGDRWRRVDPATDEVLDVLDLGTWRPVFATPGHLWVTAPTEDRSGIDLARVPLE